ncbi:ATP-dependent helicase BRM [Sesamum indicum]|uniref:ATP-dependent helicase BRM n=1 Tax=Sesamum indicum TaxID=4182 RepID=A0A6I9U780_SESIN|nr:ATP-dependent helicase BRM [Sesamum indicum]XP_011093130.1 ATP-dependent helicase BRM [Sesamum indicum]XP_020553703.1 ATP-dependent helicase BRM [Sesamum indicum]
MQSSGPHPGGGGHGWSTAALATASTSSSSSAFDQQQQQQQQQKQSLHEQFLRRPEGSDALLAYQAGNFHGVLGGSNFTAATGSMQLPQKPRQFVDFSQQHVSPNFSDHGRNWGQVVEQQMMNPMQYAFQAAEQRSALGVPSQQQMKLGTVVPLGKDQDSVIQNIKMQQNVSARAFNQSQTSSSKKSSECVAHCEKQAEHNLSSASDGRPDPESNLPTLHGQAISSTLMHGPQLQQNIVNMANNPITMTAQMQALALERNIDLSHPANANVIAQLIPLIQSRMFAQQKANRSSTGISASFANHVTSSQIENESSPHGNSSSEVSGQSGSSKARLTVSPSTLGVTSRVALFNSSGNISVHGIDSPLPPRQHNLLADGMPPLPQGQCSGNFNQGVDGLFVTTTSGALDEASQIQHAGEVNRPPPQSLTPPNDGNVGHPSTSQGGPLPQMRQPYVGFTKQQLHVLKAQILAFRRLKKEDRALPRELLQAIVPPPLDMQIQQVTAPPVIVSNDRLAGENVDGHAKHIRSSEKGSQVVKLVSVNNLKEEGLGDNVPAVLAVTQSTTSTTKEPRVPPGKGEQQSLDVSAKCDQEPETGTQKTPVRNEVSLDRGKAVASQPSISDTMPLKNSNPASSISQPKDAGSTRKYHGPLFDFPIFTRKNDTLGPSMMNSNNLVLAYDINDLLSQENGEIRKRKRKEKIEKIDRILAVNLERKRIRPDLVIRLQIESKTLQLAECQARLREEIEQQQVEIMAMPDRPYRKFVRLCERQRQELNRQSQANQKATRDRQLKSILQWRKKLLETHWAIRDARTARNRGVHKYHERMLREFSKRKDDDRNKRMEALKNNDVERYREMLLEQQTNVPGDAAERYAVLSSFLTQTEEYLHKLGSKITVAKNQQEFEEAANAAAAAARLQGLSEEEVRAAAACAREEVMIRNRFSEMNARKDSSSVNKYYNLAHAVSERVISQPTMLRAGTLREYQLVGLQWMLSLYNNKLNGILADEMGLGKTVQVMALIAYLMEFKGNYGPHLIIVPNAVLVNWKSELHNWLPSVSCIYYVGGKDQRSKLFSQEVLAMKFNVLVTTYEFIMYDRSKLSKVDWKYIIIDEAQRMKDRESVLARDLDRYRCQRRLLLTGTPLQNDLKELWSLLNLLLPEVFDNRKVFHDWFSQPFQKEGSNHNAEDDWLETEKKVITIHRLHQILEPFMLRRRVEDVEGSLPPKVSIVLKCRMSAIQSAIYDWIKSTGTLRVDPEDEQRKVQKNALYQAKSYRTLNNRCMELRKACNHPLLNYPYFSDFSKDFLVGSCGKLWILDRILIKLQRTGHRVLLFSTMTKLLDIMEEYLQWRRLVFRRIDGTTSLEDRESAIVDFNSPDTDCFIFLLSIRAAGRGLNLQSADTVIIYDPDPNPKNEEQAVARAHRIGQTREVKVIYMEAVVDKISSHQKEDEIRSGGAVDSDEDLAGKDRYMGSIESLIRNNIQQYKIEMADEVINAGRFDQRTTHEERRLTLETLLHDEERYQETVHDVPSLHEVNRMIARSEAELELFDQMDEELDWVDEMTRYDQVPKWLRTSTQEVNATISNSSKKPSKNALFGGTIGMDSSEAASETERRRGRPKGKTPIYTELDEGNEEYSEASFEDRNGYSVHEEGEIGEFEDDESTGEPGVNKHSLEEDGLVSADGCEYQRAPESLRNDNILEEAGSSGSSSHSQRLKRIVSPSLSSQKFGSLSALDGRSTSHSKKLADELEEGEIAVSGDSQMDHQQSGGWIQDRDEGEDEQVLQPKIKRKRSIRLRPRLTVERSEEKHNDKSSLPLGDPSQLPFQVDGTYGSQARDDRAHKFRGDSSSLTTCRNVSSVKNRRNLLSKKNSNTGEEHPLKSGRVNYGSTPPDDAAEHSRETWDSKVMKRPKSSANKMSEVIQRKCKNVINKLQRRIDKEGHQIVPMLTELWRRCEKSSGLGGTGDNLLDLRKIDLGVDNYEYNGVMELVSDVQLMLKCSMQFYGSSYEVRSEARKVHDLFFDILKIAFPDTDFQEARNSISFSSSVATPASGPSSRQKLAGQSKSQKLVKNMDAENSPFQKPHSRVPFHTVEDTKVKSYVSRKESRLSSGKSSRELGQADNARLFTHPGDLVTCKKKRKDREKSAARSGNGLGGPVSPTGIARIITGPGSKDQGSSQQSATQRGWAVLSPQQGNDSGSVGWANPVKRMRTDAGRRRPSHI